MIEGLVSVIMPTFNSGQFLVESINGILNQTYEQVELIVIDDCSTDETTVAILKAYIQKDNRVDVVFLDANVGAGMARNKAIERARGQYIAFCDSDDVWTPNKLEIQINAMKRGGYALCCSSYYIIDNGGNVVGINNTPGCITFGMMKRDNKIGCLTAIYDVRALGRKYYMPTLRKRQDWALFLAIMRDCNIAYGVSEPLAYYRKRVGSISSRKMALIKYNIAVYRECLHFSYIKSLVYFAFCFLPTYFTKVIKQKIISYMLVHK